MEGPVEVKIVLLWMLAGWCGTYVPWRWRCCWPWPWPRPWPWPPPPPPPWSEYLLSRESLLGIIGGLLAGGLVAWVFAGLNWVVPVIAAYLGGQLALSLVARQTGGKQ